MNNDEKLVQLLNTSRCLSKKQMLNYRNGVLFPEELRAVELHLAECELCNYALEGFEHIKDPEQLINSLKLPVLAAPKVIVEKKEKEKEKEKEEEPVKPAIGKVLETDLYQNSSRQTNAKSNSKRVEFPQERPSGRTIYKIAGIAAILVLGFGVLWYVEFRDGNKINMDNTALLAENDINPDTNKALSSAKDTEETTLPTSKTGAIIAANESSNQGITDPEIHKADSNLKVIHIEPKAETLVSSNKNNEDEKKSNAEKVTEKVTEKVKNKDIVVAKKAVNSVGASSKKDDFVEQKSKLTTNSEIEKKPEVEQKKKIGQQTDYEIGRELFKKKQYASALLYLNTSASDKNDPHYWDAVYYAALCNKNLDNSRKAKKLFKQIIKADAPQKSAAEQQLQELGTKDDD